MFLCCVVGGHVTVNGVGKGRFVIGAVIAARLVGTVTSGGGIRVDSYCANFG